MVGRGFLLPMTPPLSQVAPPWNTVLPLKKRSGHRQALFPYISYLGLSGVGWTHTPPWEAQKPIGNGWTTGGVKESSKMAQEVGSQSPVWFFPIHQLVAHATLPLSPPQGHITCLLSGSHLKNRSPERERICQSIHSKSGTKWLGN